MLDFNPAEFLVVGVVALLVIGPKDLPKAMRFVGQWVGKARGVARQFRSGFDSMMREAELAEMEKRWAEENARIMRDFPTSAPIPSLDAPASDSAPPAPKPVEHEESDASASKPPAAADPAVPEKPAP